MLLTKNHSTSPPHYHFLFVSIRYFHSNNRRLLKKPLRILSCCAKRYSVHLKSVTVFIHCYGEKVVRTLHTLKSKSESTLTFRGGNHSKGISNSNRVQGVNHFLNTRPPTRKILFCTVGYNPDTETLP